MFICSELIQNLLTTDNLFYLIDKVLCIISFFYFLKSVFITYRLRIKVLRILVVNTPIHIIICVFLYAKQVICVSRTLLNSDSTSREIMNCHLHSYPLFSQRFQGYHIRDAWKYIFLRGDYSYHKELI